MTLLDLLAQPLWQHGTWALVHFLWQGAAIALVNLLLRRAIEWRSASARYTLGLAALTAMALCVPVTFGWLMLAGHERGSADAMPLIAGELLAQPESLPVRADSLAVDLEHWAVVAQPWLAAMWLGGVACFGLRLLVSFAGVAWLAYSARELPADLVRIAKRVARRLGLSSAGDVFLSDRVTQAAAIGFLRPLVLLPAAWATQLDAATLEAVIAHELAHVRRWDLWVNLLQRCLETLLFYHPAVWWLSGQVRAEREMCCDEMAAEASGDRAGYVAALVKVTQVQVARQGSAACAPLLGAGMGGDDMALLERVRYVLGLSPEGENGRWWPIGLAALALPAVAWVATVGLGGITLADDGDRPKEGERVKEENRKEGERKEGEPKRKEGGDKEAPRKEKEGDARKDTEPKKSEARKESPKDNALSDRIAAARAEVEKARAAVVEGEEYAKKVIAGAKSEEDAKELKQTIAAKMGALRERAHAAAERAIALEREAKQGLDRKEPAKESTRKEQANKERSDAEDLVRAAKLKATVDGQRQLAQAQLKAAHAKFADQTNAEQAKAQIAQAEAKLREAIERTGSEEEARAIREKASAYIQAMREKLKAAGDAGEAKPKTGTATFKEGGHEKELLAAVRDLQSEVARLRAEVNELRGQRGDAKPKAEYRKEGGDRKPEAGKKEEPRKEDRKPEARKEDLRKEEPRKEGEKKPER